MKLSGKSVTYDKNVSLEDKFFQKLKEEQSRSHSRLPPAQAI